MTTIAEIESQIMALGEGTPAFHEAMAFYLMTLARAQWREADLARKRHATGATVPWGTKL